MARRETPRRRLRKVNIGDMRDKVQIHRRDVQPPAYDSAEPTEKYVLAYTRWMQIETFNPFGPFQGGERLFDGVAPTDVVTHLIKMRYVDDLTIEDRLVWLGTVFKIDKIVNPEDRNQYWEIYAVKLGPSTKGANL